VHLASGDATSRRAADVTFVHCGTRHTIRTVWRVIPRQMQPSEEIVLMVETNSPAHKSNLRQGPHETAPAEQRYSRIPSPTEAKL
jgi:hypothetical protein